MPFSDSVRLAVGTLTVLPTGPVQLDRTVARGAMLIAPLAVAPLAVVAAGVGYLGSATGWPPTLCGLLSVAVLALGTRALHLDGLADTTDGLGSGWDREKALAVMRRGDVGPMGVTALILVLGLQSVAMGGLLGRWPGAVTVAALICCSRAVLSLVCVQGVPAARPDGLGATVAGTVPRWAAAVTWLAVTAVLVLLFGWQRRPWGLGVGAAVAVLFGTTLLLRTCLRRFGGVTGDVMGACVEVALTVLLLAAAL